MNEGAAIQHRMERRAAPPSSVMNSRRFIGLPQR